MGHLAAFLALGATGLPEGEPAAKAPQLGLKERDIVAAQLFAHVRNLLQLLPRLAEQPLLEADHLGIDGTPVVDVVGIAAVPVLAFHQPVEVDDPLNELWRLHRAQMIMACLSSLPVGTTEAVLSDVDLRSEEHTSELQSLAYLVCRLL